MALVIFLHLFCRVLENKERTALQLVSAAVPITTGPRSWDIGFLFAISNTGHS